VTSQDPSPELHELVPIVAHRAGTDANCLSATALLVESAKLLGIPLRPVPVSMWTKSGVSDAASTGRRGREFGLTLTDQSRDLTIGSGDWYREVGHMVAVLDAEPSVLLDASFRQFSKFGLPDVPVLARIGVSQLADGDSWDVAFHANGTEARIRYWPVEADTSWLVDYRSEVARSHELAGDIADYLRSGGSARQFIANDL
jgi:hypothetical protein